MAKKNEHRASRPFTAKHQQECADGDWDTCGHIKPGDLIVRRPFPRLFDMPYAWQRRENKMYREAWYSHVECYKRGAEADARIRESIRKERSSQRG